LFLEEKTKRRKKRRNEETRTKGGERCNREKEGKTGQEKKKGEDVLWVGAYTLKKKDHFHKNAAKSPSKKKVDIRKEDDGD